MNISDIQTTLNRILKYNKNLDEAGLKILLMASDWNESDTKDALFLFRRNQNVNVKQEESVASEQPIINLVKNDTKVETVTEVVLQKEEVKKKEEIKEVITEVEIPQVKVESKNNVINTGYFKDNFIIEEKIENSELEVKENELSEVQVQADDSSLEEEMLPSAEVTPDHLLNSGINELEIDGAKEVAQRQELWLQKIENEKVFQEETKPKFSLVKESFNFEEKKNEIRKILDERPSINHLPENLPLKPYDSSPHTVPLVEYDRSFFANEPSSKNSLGGKEKIISKNVTLPKIKYVPLSEKDKKLVWLASAFLVVILLLIMYMQNSGRM